MNICGNYHIDNLSLIPNISLFILKRKKAIATVDTIRATVICHQSLGGLLQRDLVIHYIFIKQNGLRNQDIHERFQHTSTCTFAFIKEIYHVGLKSLPENVSNSLMS